VFFTFSQIAPDSAANRDITTPRDRRTSDETRSDGKLTCRRETSMWLKALASGAILLFAV